MLEKLLGTTQEILSSLQRETGYRVQLVPDRGPYLSSALISAREKNGDGGHVVIAYDPEAPSIDYAIAHESVRFLRFLRAPPEKRLMLASDHETREYAYSVMEEDIANKPGLLRAMIRKGFPFFYDGILTQLVSTPGDFWINQSLFQEFPDFRSALRTGLNEIFRRAHISYAPEVEAITPQTIYEVSHTMTAALAIFSDGLLHTSRYSRPYRKKGFHKQGKRLHDLNPEDKGYLGDMAVVDCWAEALGLKGWFMWKSAEGPS